jgi:predicted nucleic acid-binding protein
MEGREMILLDTNYLIKTLVKGSREEKQVRHWFSRGDDLCTSGIVWYEFLCGPVADEEVILILSLLDGRVLPFTGDHAAESARLFNAAGRVRRLRVDAMIAAAAVMTNAALATDNAEDFRTFVPFGLRLAGDKQVPQ